MGGRSLPRIPAIAGPNDVSMTAFELCRRQPELELAPVLRIVKYLGLDSDRLDDEDVARIEALHVHFRHDPELIVGRAAVAERAGLDADRIEGLLRARRREIPFLGTAERPMVPAVAIEMLRRADRGIDRLLNAKAEAARRRESTDETEAEPGAELRARIGRLEKELAQALEQVRSLSRAVHRISDGGGSNGTGQERQRHRRSGGGRPDTIVEACRTVLAESSGPMKVADITERVLSRGVSIRAKNPNVTVSSILSSYEVFHRVRRGYYELVDGVGAD